MQIKGSAGLPGILMLQGTLDAATPYAGALAAHRALPSARMVVVKGGGNHGQSLADPPNSCVNGYLNRYLATGALPQGPARSTRPARACPPHARRLSGIWGAPAADGRPEAVRTARG